MKIVIDNQSKNPIYTQIYLQLREYIADGTLKPDEKLPSIRGFALDLKVSVITIKRTYEDLERDGLIYSIPGKGSYVQNIQANILKEKYVSEIEGHLSLVASLASQANLSEETILKLYKKELSKL